VLYYFSISCYLLIFKSHCKQSWSHLSHWEFLIWNERGRCRFGRDKEIKERDTETEIDGRDTDKEIGRDTDREI